MERGKPAAGHQGRLGERPEATVGVHRCAAAATSLRAGRAAVDDPPAESGFFVAEPETRAAPSRPLA